MKFEKEFKQALINMPQVEKDRLFLRLLKKDVPLVNRLYFELGFLGSAEDMRDDVEAKIRNEIIAMANYTFHPGWVAMDLRGMSGAISRHVHQTKDKFGEVHLNLVFLNTFLDKFSNEIQKNTTVKYQKLWMYIVTKTFKVLLLINKLHQDYLLDFEEALNNLGKKLADNSYLKKTCIDNGLDINWLLHADLPEDLLAQHTVLRANGFLK